MRRDRAGTLRCPDDASGLDAVTLDELNAAGAGRRRRAKGDPGQLRDEGPTDAEVQANIAALAVRFGV